MKDHETEPPYETIKVGTPLDYTANTYKYYFEVIGEKEEILKIFTEIIGTHHASKIVKLTYGYEVEMPIQCVPDIVQKFNEKKIPVYQIVRYAKTDTKW